MKDNNYYALKDISLEVDLAKDYLRLLEPKTQNDKFNLERSIKNLQKVTNIINDLDGYINTSLFFCAPHINFAIYHLSWIENLNSTNNRNKNKALEHLKNVKKTIEEITETSQKREI